MITKKCKGICQDIKSLDSFGLLKNSLDGRRKECYECRNRRSKLEYKKNPKKVMSRTNKWRISNREHSNAKEMERRAKSEQHAIKRKDYAIKNRGSLNAKEANRRAKKLQATPSWLTERQRREIKEIYTLAHDLSWLSNQGLHVDHIVPLQGKIVSGLHVPWNLQIIPAVDNFRKSNRL